MAVVTGLRERRPGTVEVELDGAPWRRVPTEAAVRVGLAVGRSLDRRTARELGRELRRAAALRVALRALAHRDLSRRALEQRLERRGARPEARADALEALESAGLVDDERAAASRARVLADRGLGDAAIRAALEAEGLDAPDALAALEPEPERARRLFDRLGRGPAALRRLAAKGFDPATVEELHAFAEDA